MAQQSNKPMMTTTTTGQGNKDKENKSSREIENDIQETRSAISGDIQSLSDKLSPSHLKEEAKAAVAGAAQSAVDKAAEVKDVIVEKAVEVKDVVADKAVELKDAASEKLSDAKEAVADTLVEVGEQARRIGNSSWQYASANAVPLALIGLGAGWLIANSRRRSGTEMRYERPAKARFADELGAREYDYSPGVGLAGRSPLPAPRSGISDTSAERGYSSYREPRTSRSAKAGMERIQSGARDLAHGASESAHKLADRASRGAERVKDGLQRAGTATKNFAEENPLAIATAALVVGVGVGLALPSTEPEQRFMGPARAKFDRIVGDVREAATDVTQVAKDTASESIHALT
ncbi:MAG TPA: DUF3618 domain-containing protein [Polyangiales bacterium]|nr:DUF3618 domain-containing protein [Polyangiales bacterium]